MNGKWLSEGWSLTPKGATKNSKQSWLLSINMASIKRGNNCPGIRKFCRSRSLLWGVAFRSVIFSRFSNLRSSSASSSNECFYDGFFNLFLTYLYYSELTKGTVLCGNSVIVLRLWMFNVVMLTHKIKYKIQLINLILYHCDGYALLKNRILLYHRECT